MAILTVLIMFVYGTVAERIAMLRTALDELERELNVRRVE